ncbi:MAG TPA: AAA family ATPase [Actinospica sp.]|nr:AAA family ATPase [Actinospica sp.]
MSAIRHRELRNAPLVGRDVELAALLRRIDAARSGRAGVAFVTGEAGIGKTRLADEAAGTAGGGGVRVLRGRASRAGTSRMRPFAEALLGLAREGWSPPDGLGPYLAVLGRIVPDWSTQGQSAAAPAPFIQGEAILRVLAASAPRPALLILEDLHDADPDTIATLEYLLDNAAGQHLTIVCTARDVAGPVSDLAEYARRRDPDALLTLSRLDPAATAELAASLLGVSRRQLSGELRELLVRDGAGNPLVVTEILRDLVDADALARRGAEWTLREPRRPGAPRSLVGAVADYLAREEPVARRVMQAAAVLGDEFPADLVGAVAETDEPELWRILDSASRSRLLLPVAARDDWFVFRHPLLERAVHDQLTPSARRTLALAAAAAIEARHPDEQEWRVRAADLRESAGDTAGAGALLAAAGRYAADHGAPGAAVDLLRRALAVPGAERDTAWAELTGPLITALGALGRHQEALEHAAAVEAADRAGLPRETAADLYLRLARVALRVRGPEQVRPYTRAAERAIRGLAATAQRAELDAIRALLAVDLREAGTRSEVGTLARRAVERARAAALPPVECDALLTLGYHYGNAEPELALESYQQAYRVARDNGLTAFRSEALLLLGAHRWTWHADPAGLKTAEAEASADGAVLETRLAQLSLAVDALFRTRYADAQRLLDLAWDDIVRLKLPKLGSYALALRAVLHAHQGHEERLAATVAEFDQWSAGTEDEASMVRGLAQGVAALLRGDVDAAGDHLDSLRAPDGGFRATKYYLCGEFGLAALVHAVNGPADRTGHQEIAAQTASGIPWNRQFVEFADAVLAGREGRPSDADACVARALETSAPFPLGRHLALSLISASAARDGWGEPARWLHSAEAFFKGAGLVPAAQRCRDLLRGLGEPNRQWRDGSPGVPRELWAVGVTVREYEVLRWVAHHETNREIAARLHLSHRTVERHVTNLIAKTGAGSRRELASRAQVTEP